MSIIKLISKYDNFMYGNNKELITTIFANLPTDRKIYWLKRYGYDISGDVVFAHKRVSVRFASMWGTPVYDEPMKSHYIDEGVYVWRSKGKGDLKYEKKQKKFEMLYEGKNYTAFIADEAAGYSRNFDFNHGSGLWSSSKRQCVCMTPNDQMPKTILVSYNINDSDLVLCSDGHLRSLQMRVVSLNPSTKYDVCKIGHSYYIG